MSRFGLVGPSYTSQSVNADAQRTVNWYVEQDESGAGNAPLVMYNTPGLRNFCNMDPVVFTSVRGSIEIAGRVFTVCGKNLNENFANGTFVTWGQVGNDAQPVTMAASPQQMLIASAGVAYVFTLGTNTLAAVPGGTFDGPVSIVGICDDFFIAVIADSKEFYVSAALNANDWVSNGSAIVSVFPDNIIGMLVDHREVWFWSDTQSTVYYDSGNIFPFDVLQGAFIEAGIAAKSSPAQINNTVMWLGADARGAGVVWMAQGYTPTRVSNHAVETAIQAYTRIDDAVAFSYQDQGHEFYVIYFPTPSTTWVYDINTQMWHERGFWLESIGQYRAAHYWNHVFAFGKHLVGDWQSGKLYQMSVPVLSGTSWLFCDDDGNPTRRVRRAPHISSEQKYMTHAELQVYLESGEGPEPPLLSTPGTVVSAAAGAGASVSGGAGEVAWITPSNIMHNTPGTYASVSNGGAAGSTNSAQNGTLTAPSGFTDSVVITPTSNILVGDIGLMPMMGEAQSVVSMTDTLGNLWQPVGPSTTFQGGTDLSGFIGIYQLWFCVFQVPVTAGAHFTVHSTWTGSVNNRCSDAFINVTGAGGIDQEVTASINVTPGNATFTQTLTNASSELVLAFGWPGVGLTGRPFSAGSSLLNWSNGQVVSTTASGVVTATWTQGSASDWAGTLIAFLGPATAETSQLLQATSFGLAIPAGATVLGFSATVNGKQTAQVSGAYLGIGLIGAVTPHGLFNLPLADGSSVVGSPTDLWGANAYTPAQLNAAGFGFSIQGVMPAGTSVTLDISGVVISVWYLPAGTSVASVARGPALNLRWSNDGGHKWSNTRTADCGQIGDFRRRVIFRQLGRARDRVYEISGSDPVPYRIVDGYLRIAP